MTVFTAVPTDVDTVLSTAWLTEALQSKYPGVVVSEARDAGRIESTALKVRIHVEYGDRAGHDPLTHLFVKGYFSDEAIAVATAAAIGPRNGFACREVRFYQELAPLLDIRIPEVAYSAIEPESEIGIVLMEDVEGEGGRCFLPETPYRPDQAAATLGELARLHARFWGNDEMANDPWLQPKYPWISKLIDDETLDALLVGPRGEGIPAEVRRAARIRGALGALGARHAKKPRCLLHADAHAGNLFQDAAGRSGFVDWQNYEFGHWSMDVAYHIGSVFEPADRAAHERELLTHYLGRLAAAGVDAPSFDEAWDDYRTALTYGYFMWAITRRVEERITVLFNRRLGTAVTEHDSFGLLGI
jgi:hypothetical protein